MGMSCQQFSELADDLREAMRELGVTGTQHVDTLLDELDDAADDDGDGE